MVLERSFETIKKFKIVPVEMGVDNYLTPSLKIKKKRVIEDFSQLVDILQISEICWDVRSKRRLLLETLTYPLTKVHFQL